MSVYVFIYFPGIRGPPDAHKYIYIYIHIQREREVNPIEYVSSRLGDSMNNIMGPRTRLLLVAEPLTRQMLPLYY